MRGATAACGDAADDHHISIHAPRAGSDWRSSHRYDQQEYFNPRSPCGERPNVHYYDSNTYKFQSTLPVRGATDSFSCISTDELISIHAPRAGSDLCSSLAHSQATDFNPRSPCGERHLHLQNQHNSQIFQSTLPVRGATEPAAQPVAHHAISIHAPRAGSDRLASADEVA